MRVFQNVEDLGDLKAALREAFEVKKNRFQYHCPPHLLQQQPAHAVEHAEGSHESWHERHRARR